MEILFSMTKVLRVVFAGTPENAATTLAELHAAGINIVGVLTRKDAKVGKAKEMSASPVGRMAEQLGLGIRKSNVMDDGTLAWLQELGADLGVVVAYGTVFRADALAAPRLGWVNLHYSLLPELPGPAPVQHALLKGSSTTGVTVFRLDEGIDTGPIVSQLEIGINRGDNAGTLLARLTDAGSKLLQDILRNGEESILSAVAQPNAAASVAAFKPTRSLARLDFNSSAESLHNKVRAMHPEPMAWFEVNGVNVRVLSARAIGDQNPACKAQVISKELVVGCQLGSLVLEQVQPAGKNVMSGADWFRGLHLESLEIS
jgi:methionyl-tRNA formyltransferase